MGFKKGRAARAAAAAAAAAEGAAAGGAAGLDIQNDDGPCVSYMALNGFKYEIDVEQMVQTNLVKGTQRTVFRHQGHGKNWTMWQYEAIRAAGRNYTHSRTTYMQYPKQVCFALETCWRKLRSRKGESESAKRVGMWRSRLSGLSPAELKEVFGAEGAQGSCSEEASSPAAHTAAGLATAEPDELTAADSSTGAGRGRACSSGSMGGSSAGGEELSPQEIAEEAGLDAALREALFERVVQSGWPAGQVASATRWLLRRGLEAAPDHCRTAALMQGSLTVLRVLLVEAGVDVRGLVLLEGSTSACAKQATAPDTSNSGWVQRCKPALKALMARGALLGEHSSRSKLLKRLQDDADARWARRAVEGLCRRRPELPELAAERIAALAGAEG